MGPYQYLPADAPVTIGRGQAQRLAAHELSKSQYHDSGNAPGGQAGGVGGGVPSQQPTPGVSSPTPTPPPTQHGPSPHVSSILLIVLGAILLIVVGLLLLRHFGKPRSDVQKKTKSAARGSAAEEQLTGAAAHRRDAELAARRGAWDEAIRERFRAVIATLDERGLLPERADRTADEAARDAGHVVPRHAAALSMAARFFDDVEYGELVGSPEGYELISTVDEHLVRGDLDAGAEQPAAASEAAR